MYFKFGSSLVEGLRKPYHVKQPIYQPDYLLTVKSSLVMRAMQDWDLEMLSWQNCTFELSTVENVIAERKSQLRSHQFTSVERTASEMAMIRFGYIGLDLQVFDKKLLNGISHFRDQTGKDKIAEDLD